MSKHINGIFPGSFDPFHAGHIFILEKALKNDFEHVYLVIAQNPNKSVNKFEMNFNVIDQWVKNNKLDDKVTVMVCKSNIPHLALKLDVEYIIRGYRNINDWIYERSLRCSYHKINPLLKMKLYRTNKLHKSLRSH